MAARSCPKCGRNWELAEPDPARQGHAVATCYSCRWAVRSAAPEPLPELGIPAGTWVGSALCGQIDPEIWFPTVGGSTSLARRFCGTCEVKTECLAWAVESQQEYGIWGGHTAGERRKLHAEQSAETIAA